MFRFIDICRYLLHPPAPSKNDASETNTPPQAKPSLSANTTPIQASNSQTPTAKAKPAVPVPLEQFCDLFLARLLVLARDPVSNVRLTLARFLSDHLQNDGAVLYVYTKISKC